MVHAITRKKSLVEKLAVEGLSISYSRLNKTQDNIMRQLCQQGLFTVTAIDNADDDPSSATAKCSFYGTSISVYQRNERNLPHKKFIYENKTHFKSTMPELPENYINIMPTKCGEPEFQSNKLQSKSFFLSESETRNEATAWLDTLQESVSAFFFQVI